MIPVAQQIGGELQLLLWLLLRDPPKVILEIGVAKGGSIERIARVCDQEAIILGVDKCIPRTVSFGEKRKWIGIEGDSHSKEVMERVRGRLGGRLLDFLFIDGDHEGVEEDFTMYGPLVRPGGWVAFHDIHDGPRGNVGIVPEFWRKIKQHYFAIEIIAGSPGGYGIGVIRYDPYPRL